MRNNLLLLLLLLFLPLSMTAQSYTVYSVVGTVRWHNGKAMVPLKPRNMLTPQTSLQLGTESAVTVIDEKNAKMYSFTSPGTHTVATLIKSLKGNAKNLSKQYISYVVKQLFSDDSEKMSHPNTYMQATATAFRSTSNDSLFLRQLAVLLQTASEPSDTASSVGTPASSSIEQRIIDSATSVSTDFDVQYELIDCTTGLPLDEHVAPNTSCYLRVTNRTADLLYVNMLDIDRQGNKYLVLPMDAAASCAHLLVPAMSTVSFKKEPFVFGDEPSVETLLLMAVREPVDFSIVMAPMTVTGKSTMPVGISRRFYRVK
jgi:hypothetical protein